MISVTSTVLLSITSYLALISVDYIAEYDDIQRRQPTDRHQAEGSRCEPKAATVKLLMPPLFCTNHADYLLKFRNLFRFVVNLG